MSKKILLADDSVTIQKVVELTFMDEGVDVVSVGNGSDALARLDDVAPDMLIADVHMPGTGGYEVCREAKRRRPGIPVLLLVGTFEPFNKDEFAASGADGFLKKPFDSQELVRQVTEMMEKAVAATISEAARTVSPNRESAVPAPVAEPSMPGLVAGAAVPPESAAEDLEATAPGDATEATQVESAPAFGPAGFAFSTPPTAETGAPIEMRLSDQDVDRVARRVVEILSEKVVREVSWEVVPDLAEVIIKDRLRELENQVE